MEFLCTAAELATILNLSESRIYGLVREGIFLQHEKSRYSLPDCIQNYINYKLKDVDDEGNDLKKEQARLTRAKCEIAEIELAQKKNEVHKTEQIEIVLGDMITAFRAKVLSIPSKVTPRLKNKDLPEIKQELENEIFEALSELSNYNPQNFIVED